MPRVTSTVATNLARGLVLLCLCIVFPANPAGGATMEQAATFRLQEATIDSIHRALRAGQISCRQLVQLYLNRIEAYDQQGPTLNTIQTLNPAALEEADRFDAQFRGSG